MSTSLPSALQERLSSLPKSQQDLIRKLYQHGQEHLFEKWTKKEDASDTTIQALAQQLEHLDNDYTNGGLIGYIDNARKLLQQSQQGGNPLQGWTPHVPQGERFQLGTDDYQATETLGRDELGKTGFVLVAGGLGERLGYTGIKVRTLR